MKAILSGNEAIARGAYEAGIEIVTGYPGTPSSEIITTIARQYGEAIYTEWSANEKVAMDAAAGAAYSGRRALVTTKQVGMNVLSDSLLYAVYTGTEAGLVVVTADDPGMHSSQNEQDNRWYARLMKIPLLEPADSQEAKDFVLTAIQLSERFDTPVLVRTVMRTSHSKSVVSFGERQPSGKQPGPFPRNPAKYNCTASNARHMHPRVEKRLEQIARKAVVDLAIEAEVIKVTNYNDIMKYPILSTPGLVINEQLVSSGRIPTPAEVTTWLADALS